MVVKFDLEKKPQCQQYGTTKFIQLTKDWFYTIDGKEYWIPNGYFYDGASIPRLFWSIIGSPFDPQFWAPALAHDWGYLTHVLSRSDYDEVIRQLLIYCGVGSFKARIIWSAVRTGGAFAWNNSIADIEELARIRTELNQRPDGGKQFLLAA